MRIDVVSTLTEQEEERLVQQLLKAAEVLLADAPFSYIINIETSTGTHFSQSKLNVVEQPLIVLPGSPLKRPH